MSYSHRREWFVARQSIHYTHLPSPFLAFDLLDRLNQTFLSRRSVSRALNGTEIRHVPLIGKVTEIASIQLLDILKAQSEYAEIAIEGVYVRFEEEGRLGTTSRGAAHWRFVCGQPALE
jgi:atypical dual specificity phosphatase